MFSRIRIRNFKAWDERLGDPGVELRPVTLFLGTNSSGKTSLLQPFRLMHQTVTSSDPGLQLNLGGETTDLVNLGAWSEVIHGHKESNSLHLGFDLDHDRTTTSVDLQYGLDTAGRIVVRELAYRRDERKYAAVRQTRGGYRLVAPGFPVSPGHRNNVAEVRRTYEPVRSLTFSPDATLALGPELAATVVDLGMRFFRKFERISYLGPLRAAPRRTEQWNQQRPGNLGSDGSGAIKALLASVNDRNKNDDLIRKVGSWLQRMKIADRLEVRQLGNTTHYDIRVIREGVDCNLLDVGFGVSQVLPVLTLAYFAPRNSTVIMEEPEIHLHPLAQSLLADLFVEVARERHVQFLVETHSEHLFRRLQTLVADERISHEQCRMYFVTRDRGDKAELQALHLDEFGRVANWPENFFGDALGETERQMSRMMERMMSARRGTR